MKKGITKFEVVETYEFADKKGEGDPVEVELFMDGTSVLKGDWYKNHIEDRIEGFMQAFTVLGLVFDLKMRKKRATQ